MAYENLRLSPQELADLPTRWENSTVDVNKYAQSALVAWEVDALLYQKLKKAGMLCQQHKGNYYVAI